MTQMQFENKYNIGDKVWIVFNIGPNIKVNEFTIQYLQAEKMQEHPVEYNYGVFLGEDGVDGHSINLSFFGESQVYPTKEEAVADAEKKVEELRRLYDDKVNKILEQVDDMKQESLKLTTASLFVVVPEEKEEVDHKTEAHKPEVKDVEVGAKGSEDVDKALEGEAETIKRLKKKK